MSVQKPSKTGAPTQEPRSTQEQPIITLEGIDCGKVNRLLDTVSERLKSNPLGNLYIEGSSSTGNDSRHNQLQEVFELRRQLELVQAAMVTRNAQSTVGDHDEVKKPGKPNGNQLATIRNVVQEQLSGQLRDLAINNERQADTIKRQDDRIKKAEANYETLAAKVKSLEGKMKKPHALGQLQAGDEVEAKIDALEDSHRQLEGKQTTASSTVKKLIAAVQRLASGSESSVCTLETQQRQLEESARATNRSLERLRDKVQANANVVKDTLDQLRVRVRVLEATNRSDAITDNDRPEAEGKILEIEHVVHKDMHGWRERLEERLKRAAWNANQDKKGL